MRYKSILLLYLLFTSLGFSYSATEKVLNIKNALVCYGEKYQKTTEFSSNGNKSTYDQYRGIKGTFSVKNNVPSYAFKTYDGFATVMFQESSDCHISDSDNSLLCILNIYKDPPLILGQLHDYSYLLKYDMKRNIGEIHFSFYEKEQNRLVHHVLNFDCIK